MDRLAGEVHAQFLEDFLVYVAQQHCGVDLTAFQQRKRVQSLAAVLVVRAQDRKGDQDLVRVEARIVAVKEGDLRLLDRLDEPAGDQFDAVVDPGKMLCGLQKKGGARPQKVGGLGAQDGAVGKLDGGGRIAGGGLTLLRGDGDAAIFSSDPCLLQKQRDLADLALIVLSVSHLVEGGIVATDDLVVGGLAADIVVADAAPYHIHTHVGRGLVRVLAVDALEQGVQHREYLDVPVVVDRRLAVGLQVERIDHIHIVQIRCGGLVGDVDRVLQRKVPDRERLELGIAGGHSLLVLVVELAKAHGHLATTRPRSRHDDERTCGLHVVVLPVPLFGIDQGHIVRVALDRVVVVGLDAHLLELRLVRLGAGLAVEVGDHDAADEKAPADELCAQSQDIHVVGDAVVGAHLVLLDVVGTDDDDDLGTVAQLLEHPQLAVRLESGQNPAGVIVVEKLAPKFQIEFISELGNAFLDVF